MKKHRSPFGLKTLPSSPAALPPRGLWTAEPALLRAAPAGIAGWLTEPGLLTDRICALSGVAAALTLVEERPGHLTGEQQSLLLAPTAHCMLRRIELTARDRPWVYAESLIPDHTLERYPWLAELGVSSLGSTLAACAELTRGPFEFALLPAIHPLAAQALARATVAIGGIWARRSWFALGGRRLLVQEAFMPDLGRC